MTLLQVKNLVKQFPVRGGFFNRVLSRVHAVSDVSFSVNRGETVGVVGESGCGKSTLGKVIIRLHEATGGQVVFDGEDITHLGHQDMIPFRQRIQMIFQDPYSSLNPRMTVRRALLEAIKLHKIVPPADMDGYIASIMEKVGLRVDAMNKYPHEFSGGQRQRIGIARALALKPDFLIADEPVSALDVSIQAQVLNLLMDLRDELGLTLLFISHDLKVVEHFCDRVLVMYLGKLVEEVRCDELHDEARHPYTQALLGANPINDPADRRPLTVLEGDVPSPFDPPPGCPFAGRCPRVQEICHSEMPELRRYSDDQQIACWAVEDDAKK